MVEERRKLTKEEIQEKLERKVALAQQRDARVIQISTYRGNTMTNILRQFDKMYNMLKARIGESGEKGIPFEEGGALMVEAEEIVLKFSRLTEKMAEKLNFKYFVPDEIDEKSKATKPEAAK
jgi:hypothetical protein